jgi:hypothetical protein
MHHELLEYFFPVFGRKLKNEGVEPDHVTS